jgi:hypothetical protein
MKTFTKVTAISMLIAAATTGLILPASAAADCKGSMAWCAAVNPDKNYAYPQDKTWDYNSQEIGGGGGGSGGGGGT